MVRPQMNLPPESAPYVRSLEQDIDDLKREAERRAGGELNSNKGQNATLDVLSQQIADIVTVQSDLVTAQASLAKQIAIQGAPVTGHATVTGYALTSSLQELTRVTFTVPANVTRALVLGTANISVANQHNSLFDILRGYLDINAGAAIGTPGPTMVDPLHWANVNTSGSVVLTGLAAGNTFYMRVVAYNDQNRTGAASANNICNLDVAVIFLP